VIEYNDDIAVYKPGSETCHMRVIGVPSSGEGAAQKGKWHGRHNHQEANGAINRLSRPYKASNDNGKLN